MRMWLANLGCVFMLIASVLKLTAGELVLGFLLLGFTLSLWSTLRLRERLVGGIGKRRFEHH